VLQGDARGSRRDIVHMDADSFFASVEVVEDPSLRGKPVVVGAKPGTRGVVSTCSYEARAFGVHSAMPINEAYRRCPQGVFLPVRHGLYRDYSNRMFAIVAGYADRVQPLSVDEGFIDLSGVRDAVAVAREIKGRILAELGFAVSIGLASNKLVAKIATDQGKPDGFVVVATGTEAAFLAPLPIRQLWGVGPKTAERLAGVGINTIGEIASAAPETLAQLVGSHYWRELQRHALGLDDSLVEVNREVKSISEEITFQRDVEDRRTLWKVLVEQSSQCSAKLKERGLLARTVTVKMRYADFHTITRAMSLPVPTEDAEVLAEAAAALMRRWWAPDPCPLRLLGLRVSGFELATGLRQLPLGLDTEPLD